METSILESPVQKMFFYKMSIYRQRLREKYMTDFHKICNKNDTNYANIDALEAFLKINPRFV